MKQMLKLFAIGGTVLIGALIIAAQSGPDTMVAQEMPITQSEEASVIVREQISEQGLATVTFAGGCFWCTESAFQETEGVYHAISGYAGGVEYNPTYEDVYSERTSHREAVRVYYKPSEVSFDELLDIYWRGIDPTDAGGQFIDRGRSYTTAIFYESPEQKTEAEQSRDKLAQSEKFAGFEIVTEIVPFTTFYEAEQHHQDFYLHSAERYKNYTDNSGRKEFYELVWQEIQKEEAQ